MATNHMVTRAEFDGSKADHKRTLGVLKQLIEGGGYTIRSLTFTTVEDSILYCHCHFPQDNYDCVVGLAGLMGSITDAVVSQEDVYCQNLMGSRTGMIPQQLMVVASFSSSYPAVLVGPTAERDRSKDFSDMKTFEEWDKEDPQHSLLITLTKSMCDEVTAL